MGQGQEVHARRLMAQGMANGGWLLLQNCHLSLDYVEEVLDLMIETETIHQEFRLWVTTEVHKKFPINFLQVKKSLGVHKLYRSFYVFLCFVNIFILQFVITWVFLIHVLFKEYIYLKLFMLEFF